MSSQDLGQYNAAVRQNGVRLGSNEPLVATGTVNLPASTSIGAAGVIVAGVVPTGVSAAKGTLYVNTAASTTTTRLYVNTDGGTTWASFTASA